MYFFYLLVFAAPMPNHPLFEAHLLGFTGIKWIGIACCVYAFYEMWKGRSSRGAWRTTEVRAFAVLFCIAAVSSLTLSKRGTITFNPMASYLSFALLFFVAAILVNSYERLHKTLLAAMAGDALTSLYVIREFQASGGEVTRPGYIAGDSNYFATCALLVIPFAMYFAWKGKVRKERWFCVISLVFILMAFTLASSRGALIGLGTEITCLMLLSGKSRKSAILVAAILLPLLLYAPSSPLSRLLHPAYGDELGSQIRWHFWKSGLDMIQGHPLTGIGLGNFSAYSNMFIHGAGRRHGMACNTLLELTAELGIPGLLAYIMILWGAMRSAVKLRLAGMNNGVPALQHIGEAMLTGLLGFIAASMFVSAEYQKPFWVMVALSAVVPALLKQQDLNRSKPLHIQTNAEGHRGILTAA